MPRKKLSYSNTSWGQEVEWDAIQSQAELLSRQREPGEYWATYSKARVRMEKGEPADEIPRSLDLPPKLGQPDNDGNYPLSRKVQDEVERRMVNVRQNAIQRRIRVEIAQVRDQACII